MEIYKNEKNQAVAPESFMIEATAFKDNNETALYWLANAGALINAHGTCIMIDPLLDGFDMPLLAKIPIHSSQVPHLDGVLITHCDNDHFSWDTCRNLSRVTDMYHGPHYVKTLMDELGLESRGHDIGETFKVKDINVTLTPARHNWQNESTKYNFRFFEESDYCGYWIETDNKTIWLPGDSKLLESHLKMPEPDVILFDFSDNPWHITLEGAITLANTYPNSDLVCIHWGSVDAPNMSPFNGNPEDLLGRVVNPGRIKVLAPGEKFVLGSGRK